MVPATMRRVPATGSLTASRAMTLSPLSRRAVLALPPRTFSSIANKRSSSKTPLLSSTASATTLARLSPSPLRSAFFRRSYADVASAPAPKPKKKFRFVRILYRLTQLAILAGVGGLAYNIYDLRHPHEQLPPDPSKKTLVILGKLVLCSRLAGSEAIRRTLKLT